MADAVDGVDSTNGAAAWEEEQRKLRRQEVRHAGWGVKAQVFIAVAALAATAIAAFAAFQASKAVEQAADSAERQADEARLSTAVSSLGADRAAERIAGLTLLGNHVESTIGEAEGSAADRDALRLYTVSLDIVENYLRHPPDPGTTRTGGRRGSERVENPRPSSDALYAAKELKALLDMKPNVQELGDDSVLGVDLANVQLDGLTSWAGGDDPGVDFSWLTGHYFHGVDLRGGNLRRSIWGATMDDDGQLSGSSLEQAHLQCSDLEHAVLIEVDLSDADLRGADMEGVDLRGADLEGTDLRNAKLNGSDLSNANLTRADLTGAAAHEVTREGVRGAHAAVGIDGLWARMEPVGPWRDAPNIDCVEAYSDAG